MFHHTLCNSQSCSSLYYYSNSSALIFLQRCLYIYIGFWVFWFSFKSASYILLQVGDFEMHLKRNVGAVNAPVPVAPPVPTEPMLQSTPAVPSTSSPKPSPEKSSLFASASSAVSSKLASLEASGVNGFKLVTSPTVCILSIVHMHWLRDYGVIKSFTFSFRWARSGEEEQ